MERKEIIKERLSTYGDVSVKELKSNVTIEISNISEIKTNLFVCIGTVLDIYFDDYSKIDKISSEDQKLYIKLKK